MTLCNKDTIPSLQSLKSMIMHAWCSASVVTPTKTGFAK